MNLETQDLWYVEKMKEQIVSQARCIDEVREIKHDMYAHLIVISHLLERQDHHKATEYVRKLINVPVFQKSSYVDLGNDMINALLYTRIRGSREEIELYTRGLLPADGWMDEFDQCTLFSNLISNSVEACERLKKLNRRICISIKDSKEGLCIIFSNPTEESVNFKEFSRFTSKEDKDVHGYGMKNIRKVVDKYHGNLLLECKEDAFFVTMAFPREVLKS